MLIFLIIQMNIYAIIYRFDDTVCNYNHITNLCIILEVFAIT